MQRLLRTFVACGLIQNDERFFVVRPLRVVHRKHFSYGIHRFIRIVHFAAVKRHASQGNQTPAFMPRAEPLRKQHIFQTHQRLQS